MEATFELKATYRVTGRLSGDRIIDLGPGLRMLARRFEASVSPRVWPAPGTAYLYIDRYITVHGNLLKDNGEPGGLTRQVQYWLSEPDTPEWVQRIAARIHSTPCTPPEAPAILEFS